jgi:hypothetical protein
MKGDAPDAPEYAELYTFRERVRLVLIGLAIAGAVLIPFHAWFLPALTDFAAHASCQQVAGIAGPEFLFLGLFVGMPLAIALTLGLASIPYALRVLRDEQYPPMGQKVLQPTRIRRGVAARRRAYSYMLMPTVFVAIAIWGWFQVPKIVREIPRPHCAAPVG